VKKITAETIGQMIDGGFPVSFVYGGKPFPEGFALKSKDSHSVVFAHPDGLKFRLQLEYYPDTGALEWTGWFENAGENDSAAIQNIDILDISLDCPAGESVVGITKGSSVQIDDFAYIKQTLAAGQGALYRTAGSGAYLPFANVDTGDGGLFVGLGWTGNWFVGVDQRENETRVTAGMPDADFYLHPGERVRTPRVLILPYEAMQHSHNLFRRHMIAHHLPKGADGQPQVLVCLATWGGMKTHNHLKLIRYVKENNLKYDCYWIDAGWFGPDHDTDEYQNFLVEDWAYNQGEWRVNRTIHPDGLLPISKAAHEAGMKMLLWCGAFACSTELGWYKEHPEWGRPTYSGPVGLNPKVANFAAIYMDDPEAVEFLAETVGNVLHDNGADYYREDTGLPIGHPDEEGRRGIGEMKAVEGFYRYWDGLQKKNPGMIIDNCGGGGSRLDLETLSRSYCFWRSDYNAYPNADPINGQVGTYSLHHWSPMISGAIVDPKNSSYSFRSGLGGGRPLSMFTGGGHGYGETEPPEDFDIEWHRTMLDQFDKIKKYQLGDYYPLTGCDANTDSYMAYQLDRPDLKSGMILAFRRQDCETGRFAVRPVLEEGAEYILTDLDTGKKVAICGGMDYECVIQDKPGSLLVHYEIYG